MTAPVEKCTDVSNVSLTFPALEDVEALTRTVHLWSEMKEATEDKEGCAWKQPASLRGSVINFFIQRGKQHTEEFANLDPNGTHIAADGVAKVKGEKSAKTITAWKVGMPALLAGAHVYPILFVKEVGGGAKNFVVIWTTEEEIRGSSYLKNKRLSEASPCFLHVPSEKFMDDATHGDAKEIEAAEVLKLESEALPVLKTYLTAQPAAQHQHESTAAQPGEEKQKEEVRKGSSMSLRDPSCVGAKRRSEDDGASTSLDHGGKKISVTVHPELGHLLSTLKEQNRLLERAAEASEAIASQLGSIARHLVTGTWQAPAPGPWPPSMQWYAPMPPAPVESATPAAVAPAAAHRPPPHARAGTHPASRGEEMIDEGALDELIKLFRRRAAASGANSAS